MPLAGYSRPFIDEAGNLLTAIDYEVRRISDNALVNLFSDQDGTTPIDNPGTTGVNDNELSFFCIGGAYYIDVSKDAFSYTVPYVAIGRAGETDTGVTPLTSATSLAIGTGTKVFTTVEGTSGWGVGQRMRAWSDADPTDFMTGLITAIEENEVTLDVDAVGGSGTHADWTMNISGEPGATGPAGGPITAPQGRLTLTSGVAVTASDVTGATSHYYTRAVGKHVPCYVSTVLSIVEFTEMSQATSDSTKSPAAVAANKVYAIFIWDDAGTKRCTRGPQWASDTDPGTGAGTSEFDLADGYLVNKYDITNGPAAGQGICVGAVRSDGSSQLVDSETYRWVSNLYNAVPRSMRAIEGTDTWTYATSAWRQANANAANQLDFLSISDAALLIAEVKASYSNSSNAQYGVVAVGIDNTTPVNQHSYLNYAPSATIAAAANDSYVGYPGRGRHTAKWLEYGPGTGTQTWYGDGGATLFQSGIVGWIAN